MRTAATFFAYLAFFGIFWLLATIDHKDRAPDPVLVFLAVSSSALAAYLCRMVRK